MKASTLFAQWLADDIIFEEIAQDIVAIFDQFSLLPVKGARFTDFGDSNHDKTTLICCYHRFGEPDTCSIEIPTIWMDNFDPEVVMKHCRVKVEMAKNRE